VLASLVLIEYNTKAVCSELNIWIKALRIYGNLGIVVSERAKNKYRDYTENDMIKLRQLVLLKELGIPLANIKKILDQEFNEALIEQTGSTYNQYFNKITECLNENQVNRIKWMDKWGFDSLAQNYDSSLDDKSWDVLRLFEKYDHVLDRVAKKNIRY